MRAARRGHISRRTQSFGLDNVRKHVFASRKSPARVARDVKCEMRRQTLLLVSVSSRSHRQSDANESVAPNARHYYWVRVTRVRCVIASTSESHKQKQGEPGALTGVFVTRTRLPLRRARHWPVVALQCEPRARRAEPINLLTRASILRLKRCASERGQQPSRAAHNCEF